MGLLGRLKEIMFGKGCVLRAGNVAGGFSYQNGTLASNETIFSAISMLSGAIASAPITLRRDGRKVDASEHGVAWMLEYGFNPCMTPFQFIRCMEALRDSTGAGYAIKEFDAYGNVIALWPMKTCNVTPRIERDSRELYYRVRDDVANEEAYLHNSMVVAVGHISADGITPINPIEVLRSSLEYDREVKEFSIDQMQNGLRSNVVITFKDSNLSGEQMKEFDEILRSFKRSGFLYIDSSKTVSELKGTGVIDPKVFEVENITIARVARVFNIPLEKLLPGKTTYSSAEQSDLNYLRDTILPMARMYEQEFSSKLLTDQDRAQGMQIKFSLNGFARADMKTRGDFYMKGIRTGWFCLDDVRGLEDMPPLPGKYGQEFYISKDLVPVRLLLESHEVTPTGNQSRPTLQAESMEQIAKISLNGAQINEILQIVQSVLTGQMEYASAITLLISAFPFDRETAVQILGSPQNTPPAQEEI